MLAADWTAPVVTIDGPTASGKGTIAQSVAKALGWHYLDSGALYRLVALQAVREGVEADDEIRLAEIAHSLQPWFHDGRILISSTEIDHVGDHDGNLPNVPDMATPAHLNADRIPGYEDVTAAIRAEEVGQMASRIAILPDLRVALMALQHSFHQSPGLVADGRDMGTIVFPEAEVKVFLTASAQSRAERRYKQLIEKGFSANLDSLLRDLQLRDARDSQRAAAPLRPAQGAYVLDSTRLGIEETVQAVLDEARRRGVV